MDAVESVVKRGRMRRSQAMTSDAAITAGLSAPMDAAAVLPDESRSMAIEPTISAMAEVNDAVSERIDQAAAVVAAPPHEMMEAVMSPAVRSDPTPVADAPTHIEQGSIDMATMAPPVNETTEKAQAMLGEMQGRMKTTLEQTAKMSEDMVDFARGNVEAMMASARAAAKASETLSQEAADYSRKSLEQATSAFKSFATVKSPTELFQLQSDYAKSSFDSAVAEASKMSEAMMKFAGEIAQPLSNRYALAAEKFKATV